MIKQHLHQALTMMKQHRLFTGIYISGTAVSIAATIVLFIIFYITFEKRFRQEIAPKLKSGNVYFSNFQRHKTIRDGVNTIRGIPNKYTLYTSMALFSLFAVFMGILSAFWMRSQERKSDIGIMRSMGATKRDIIGQYITETSLLVNMGFAVAMLFILHHLHVDEFSVPVTPNKLAMPDEAGSRLLHFAAVTVASYAVLMVTAILSVVIPVLRATRILPADALRDE